jgi:putative ABC transport system permease protein
MVKMPSWISTLDRKLLRDLWAMKGQAAAIATVIGAGVTMYVTYLSNFDSLQQTLAVYYSEARFADVFVSLTRAPARLEEQIATIPGVETVATRVVADVTLDVPDMSEPAVGRLVSLPSQGEPPSTVSRCSGDAGSIPIVRTRYWQARCSARRTVSNQAIRCRPSSTGGIDA